MGSASYTKGAKRAGGNHEWVRMENSEPRMDTNGAKGKFRATNGHEWARMGNSEPRMGTNGHEWNHEIQEWNHETHEKHEKRQGG